MKTVDNGDQIRTLAPLRETHDLVIALPEPGMTLNQDEEWCVVRVDGQWQEIRFHDYAQVFEVEGLYEHIFYKTLGCNSPEVIVGQLSKQLNSAVVDPGTLRALDLGAGNGMVGEALRTAGVETVVGVDIVPEAAEATDRDRPGLYEDYVVCDMTQLSDSDYETLRSHQFNVLTCVAALGFGDIPTEVFRVAFNLVEHGGWIAFNIRDRFLEDHRNSEFATLITKMHEDGIMNLVSRHKYVHRRATNGDSLEYYALIGRKMGDL